MKDIEGHKSQNGGQVRSKAPKCLSLSELSQPVAGPFPKLNELPCLYCLSPSVLVICLLVLHVITARTDDIYALLTLKAYCRLSQQKESAKIVLIGTSKPATTKKTEK